jgi:transcriptional regulator with XRE-family HTH domain
MSNKTLKTRLKEEMDTRKISFLELERQTGVKANRMYKWYQQDTNPKTDDADTLEKWLNDLEKPIEHAQVKEPEATFADKSLNNLTESNKVLSDANKTLAEANKTLAEANLVISKNHDELIQLTKMIVANSGQSMRVDPVRDQTGKIKENPPVRERLPLGKKNSLQGNADKGDK